MLILEQVSIKLKGLKEPIIDHLDLTLHKGSITTIIGLSGCGKTTLVSGINGVIDYQESGTVTGTIRYHDMDILSLNITERSKYIGTVFQDPDTQIVFSSVMAELAFGLENHCVPKDEIIKKIDSIADELNITHLLNRNPNELSGGEKQLVVLAAILVLEPDVLLLDEIMSQVDEGGIKKIKEVVLSLKRKGKTILMIEHELDHLDIADQVLLLSDKKLTPYKGEWADDYL